NNEKVKNISVNKNTAQMYNEIINLINQKTNADDKIYTFPTLVMIYLLSNRNTDTFTTFPYFDTYPDKYAIADSKILLKNPPKVIIYQDYPENVIKIHEKLFRNGNKSGQRDIIQSIDILIKTKKLNYRFFKKYENWSMYPIYVWYQE
ncbi:hypothetical protein IJG14_01435, partial [bacterium]|nr:hypothetical protein [bacterium]